MSAETEATNALTVGEVRVDPPTLKCLGFVWELAGDANRNASASVRYRVVGAEAWRDGQPLLRV